MIVSCKNSLFNQITLLCYISYEFGKKNILTRSNKMITYAYFSRSYRIKKKYL